MRNNNEFLAYLSWAAVSLVWGTTYLAIRIGVEDIPPFLFAGFRWLIAGILLFIFLMLSGKKLPEKKMILHSAIAGILMLGFGNGFIVVAEKWIPSGLTALFVSTLPLWIIIIEAILPGTPKLNLRIAFGILIGLGGISLIFAKDVISITKADYLAGSALILMAVIFWASGTIYSKYKVKNTTPLMNAVIQMLAAGSAQTIAGFFLGEFQAINYFKGDSLYAFLYLIVFGSFLGYVAYIYAISHLPASFVSTYAYINPIIALILGWLILNESLNLVIIISTLIVFSGVYLVKTGNSKAALSLKQK